MILCLPSPILNVRFENIKHLKERLKERFITNRNTLSACRFSTHFLLFENPGETHFRVIDMLLETPFLI